jgi:hypothetical protein
MDSSYICRPPGKNRANPDVAAPDPFYGQVVRGAEDTFLKKEFLLILGHTYNKVEEQSRYLTAFRSRLVDGVLLFQAPDPKRTGWWRTPPEHGQTHCCLRPPRNRYNLRVRWTSRKGAPNKCPGGH